MGEWYAVHLIMAVIFKDGKQEKYPVWENIHLLQDQPGEDVYERAARIGERASGDSDGTFCWEGRPATWRYVGIRKIIRCNLTDQENPLDGSEVTYSELEVSSLEDLSKLAAGERVDVRLAE
jgi:hypothetical protein